MMISFEGWRKVPAKKNNMKFNGRTKRMYKTKEVAEFEEYLSHIAHDAVDENWDKGKPMSLHLDITYGDRRRRDVQNAFGSICDALNGIIYDDDSQLVQVSAKKQYEKDMWYFKVTVSYV